MPLLSRIAADAVVVVHFSYVAFVIFGQLAIVAGMLLGWRWIRNLPFRLVHLAAILFVVLEAWCGVTCPLTTWENQLRARAGEATYQGDCIANWVHKALFYNAPPSVFTWCYSIFAALVVLTFALAPPRRKPPAPSPNL
jgi:polyferredoxin